MKSFFPLLAAALSCQAFAGAPETRVVIKLDDLSPKWAQPGQGVSGNWRRVVDFLKSEKIPASIGIICGQCEKAPDEFWNWVRANFGEGGQFELWCHGYTHAEGPKIGRKRQCEFSGPSAEEQTATWKKCFDLVKEKSGIEMSCLGAPFNQVDGGTVAMLKATPQIVSWFYGWDNAPETVTVIPRICDVEFPTMKPDFEKARAQFLEKGAGKTFAVQGHAGAWKPDRFEEFKKYILFLKSQGVRFVLPRDLKPGDVPRHPKKPKSAKKGSPAAVAVAPAASGLSEQSLKMQYGEGDEVVRLDATAREGWHLRGGAGRAEAVDNRVEVGVVDGRNAIYQFDLPVKGKGYRALRFDAKWRIQGVEQGDAAWKVASIQARWKNGNKETGPWIVVAKGTGSTDWRTANVEVPVPEDVDALMIRVANYGKTGRVDVEKLSVKAFGAGEVPPDGPVDSAKAPYGKRPSAERLARFTRGVSINQWFDQPYNGRVGGVKGTFSRDWQNRYVTDSELRDLAAAGIRCVRLPVDPEPYIDLATGAVKDGFADVVEGLRRMRAAGLAVIVNPHPKMQAFKKMGATPAVKEAFLKWSAEVAAGLEREFGPEWIVYEPMNEPSMSGFGTVEAWLPYQNRLVDAVRAAAPELTLIVNAGKWQGVDDLLGVKAHPDRNTVWSVHYYEPMSFTHQGSPWMRSWYQPLRNVPWPFGPEDAEKIAGALDRSGKNAAFAKESEGVMARQARDGRGSRERIGSDFEKLAQWSREQDRPVAIGEFGVDATFAREEDRVRWTEEVRRLAEKHGFIWQHWGYDGRLRIANGEPGARKLEKPMLRALGL